MTAVMLMVVVVLCMDVDIRFSATAARQSLTGAKEGQRSNKGGSTGTGAYHT